MPNDMEKRITAKMVLDSTGFNESLKGVNNNLKLAQSELKNASVSVGAFGRDSEKLKSVQEALSKQVELHTKKVDIYRESIEKSTNKMNDSIKERDKLKQSLENANKKYDEAVKLYGKESDEAKKAKESVDKLNEEYKKKEKAVESNAKQIQNYTVNMNKANAEMVKSQGELNKITKELKEQDNKWISASKTLKDHSERLKSTGDKVGNLGDNITKLGAPIVGIGALSLKFSTDFENSMAKVSTISEESEVSISDLRKSILKLSNDTGIASNEIANNVYDAISAGQKTGDAVSFVTNSTKLAKAGFAEAGQSLDLLTTIMNAYELEAKEVTKISDILINTQNLGKVTVGELSSSMGKVIPTAKAFGVNLEQVATGYAIMTAKGIKSAETTTYMASMFNELGKSGTKASDTVKEISGKSFQELIKQGKSVGDVLALMKDYADKNKLSLADLFGSAEAGKASLILSANAGNDFNEMLKSMNNTAGATDEAFKKVTNTTGERFAKSLNKLKNEAIRLGDTVAPLMDRAGELIGKITEKLSSMDNQQLKTIANVGLFTVGLGGILKITGGVIGSIGSIAGGLSKLSGALGTAKVATEGVGVAASIAGGTGGLAGLGTALSGIVVASAPWLLAGAAVVGTGYAISKSLKEEAIPSVDLFSNKVEVSTTNVNSANANMATGYETTVTKISEGTKQAVGAYIQLDDEATNSLMNLYANSTTITSDTVNLLTGKYNEMTTQIKTRMDSHYNEQYTSLDTFFKNSSALTDSEEKEALSKLQKNSTDKKAEVDKYIKEIQDILKKASDEKRALTLEEQQKINEIQNKMKVNAVRTLSDSEVESKIILERLKEYGTRVTAEQASNIIANAEKQRRETVDKAQKQYDETVKNIIKMRDETGVITAEQADKLIEDATRQKDESITKAGEMKHGVVEKIKDMNSDIIKDIDTTDGHIKTRWDKLKEWFANNPIIRWIKTMTSGGESPNSDVGRNWTGTNYWRGGLTYLHDTPGTSNNYELYDLPRGTRIYNHDASQDLVMKTAEQVATKIAEGMFNRFNGNNGINVTQNIYSPSPSPSEIARQTKNSLRELALNF